MTVRMRKGNLFADIFDSPETIKQAQFEGFSLVDEPKNDAKEKEPEENETNKNDAKDENVPNVHRGRKGKQ